jgi:hypothetical protein
MKKYICLLGLMTLVSFSSRLSAQSQEEMKAYTSYMTPGPVQQMMAKSAGAWTGAVTTWMQEGAAPTNSILESTNEMILGGRYLQTTHKGTMMGSPFEGIGTMGYDNAKKVYVSSWVDNMGTGILYMEGSYDDATKTMTLNGKSTDPLTGKDIPTREVMKFVDDTHQVFELYFTQKGKESKWMEIKYTKK